MSIAVIMAGITFLMVCAGSMSLYTWYEMRRRRALIARRLFGDDPAANRLRSPEAPLQWQRIARQLGMVALPKNESELVDIRRLLVWAGFRGDQAPVYYFGCKLGLALVLGGLYLMVMVAAGATPRILLFTFFPLAAGYYLPGVLLKLAVTRRRQRIFKELPDALDLLLICIDAGLSFDMALYRISRELAHICPVLSAEFGQYFLEIKSGLPRKAVLQNLAARNGSDSLTSVVNVLLQSARFGTDIAEALRVYIRSMRTERRQTAEEKGAKISTQLTFPMVVLILPALLIVILGPAVINILERLQGGF